MVLLDTDVISHLLRGTAPPELVAALGRVPVDRRFVCAITVGEIAYGFEKAGPRYEALWQELERRFLRRVEVLPFDDAAARVYGRLRVEAERRALPLSDRDLRLAAIAMSRDLALATLNHEHFAKTPGLRLFESSPDELREEDTR